MKGRVGPDKTAGTEAPGKACGLYSPSAHPPCPTLPLSKARSKSLPKAERDEECPEDEENVNDGSELVVAQLPWREFGCEQVPKQLPCHKASWQSHGHFQGPREPGCPNISLRFASGCVFRQKGSRVTSQRPGWYCLHKALFRWKQLCLEADELSAEEGSKRCSEVKPTRCQGLNVCQCTHVVLPGKDRFDELP
ncbi:hypothetical protein MG293_008108 [Ovis ammon polii]|uniref:Uncharacterized protein n=1 Tax=Ovis ammon polii TaxID=230172 RepID=A0AAD4U7W5_OVIAM|nr:hypothetical protein MG293_008108 [Ovis ammon polii]